MDHNPGFRIAAIWFCLPILVGCGDGLVDLRAKVLLDDKPLDGATITLVRASRSDEKGRSASGRTDAEGVARFTTYAPNDGVAPGEYRVCIIKTTTKAAKNSQPPPEVPEKFESEEDYQRYFQAMSNWTSPMSQGVPHVQTLLPRIYATPTQTPLLCEVTSGLEEVVFSLESQPADQGSRR